MVGNCVSFLRLEEPLNAFNAVISGFFYKLWNDNDWKGYFVNVLLIVFIILFIGFIEKQWLLELLKIYI